ncbi:MAG: head GIN domain-containing protein [Pseudomonadota bacterium]
MIQVPRIAAVGLASLLLASAAFAGDGAHKHKGDHGPKISKTYDLKNFEKIYAAGVYEIEVTVGEPFAVELTGYESDMARTNLKVKNGYLKLDHTDRGLWGRKSNHHSVAAKISMPDIKSIDVSGVVDGWIKGIDAERFDVTVSGVGDLDLEGACEVLKARISGVGDVTARRLECRQVDVAVSGVGDASVYASEEIDATVSGMGDIDVFGSPEKVRETSGMFSEVTLR